MVSVVRPLAETLADAADPARWLAEQAKYGSSEAHLLIARAFSAAREVYGDATLAPTGEPLFTHAVAAAAIVADLRLQPDAIAAALLFAVQDCRADARDWLVENFGKSVAELVDGGNRVVQITELARVEKLASPAERAEQAEMLRKMLLAMVADIRVVLIKLAWRTQTMHYLTQVEDEALRRSIARETMDLFAPLANRLGVWQIKWELEDLAFRHLDPLSYKKIAKLLDERRLERLDFIERVLNALRGELANAGIRGEVAGRAKHIYSIWRKMQKKKLDFSELYDIRAVRVLVGTVAECYTVLGLIHHLWQPVPGEFDDYIAHPKGNDYQSLHTAVIGPEDKVIEVQIRTYDMHEHAEFGVAAHWRYKEGGQGDSAYEEKIAWLRQLLDWREEVSEQQGLSEAFQTELFSDTVYVLTPAGKVLTLPAGSTPIDFAYSVHTDLGHRCRGAKVDGQIVPLSTPLENGQRIEILSAKEGGPSLNWIHDGWVKNPRSVSKIRHYIRQQNADTVREAGRNLLDKLLARHPDARVAHQALAEQLGFAQLDEVCLALGHGELSQRAIEQAIDKVAPPPVTELAEADVVHARRGQHDAGSVLIEGVGNLMTQLAGCCRPAPPDQVVGFVTKGRGISIHRSHCATLKRLSARNPERLIQAEWGDQGNSLFPVDIEVEARERPGLLRDVSDVLAREKLNVVGLSSSRNRDLLTRLHLTVELRGVQGLGRVLARLLEVSGVQAARRA